MSGDGTAKSEPGGADYDELISSIGRHRETTVLWPVKTDADKGNRLHQAYIANLINAIFTPGSVRDFMHGSFAGPGAEYENLNAFMGQLRGFFSQNLGSAMTDAPMGAVDGDLIEQARNLAEFERSFQTNSARYQKSEKPNSEAIYWPDPTHQDHPSSLYETLPMVEKFELLDKSTPVGSAGSCFASEIAYYLQDNKFNYVISESDEADGPRPESSARWGIIFNTPSFKQLAEKAFNERTMPKLVEYHPGGQYWQDPFRENIPFPTIDELEANRDPHIAACRDAFETCEVFFITLGLNECWEFRPDGAVATRY